MSSVFMSGGVLLPSLEHLVDHYSHHSGGLPAPLSAGVSQGVSGVGFGCLGGFGLLGFEGSLRVVFERVLWWFEGG